MSLINKIKDLCEANSTSIPKLEKELELATSSIYRWDSCSPSIVNVQKVADRFGVSVDSLLGRTCQPNTKKLNSIISTLLTQVDESVNKKKCPAEGILKALEVLAPLTVYKLDEG